MRFNRGTDIFSTMLFLVALPENHLGPEARSGVSRRAFRWGGMAPEKISNVRLAKSYFPGRSF